MFTLIICRRTKIIVEDFGKPKGLGEMLQERLKKYSDSVENWVCYFEQKYKYNIYIIFRY